MALSRDGRVIDAADDVTVVAAVDDDVAEESVDDVTGKIRDCDELCRGRRLLTADDASASLFIMRDVTSCC